MSKDIRSFFPTVKSKKKTPVIISDDEDMIGDSPLPYHKKQEISNKAQNKKSPSKLKNTSKSPVAKKSPKKEKLKPVNAVDLFGKVPVKQSKLKHENKTNSNKVQESKEKKIHDDDQFKQTLQDLDDDEMNIDLNELDRTVDETLRENPNATQTKVILTPKTPRTAMNGKESKKRKIEDLNESVLTDQEKYERRRSGFMAYKNRGEPPNQGNKEYPEGKPKCLAGLCFISTGLHDSLNSTDLRALVEKYGGRTVSAVSGKVNYIIVGDEPGPSKIEKAKNLRIPEITEDDLLDMILTKSDLPPKYKQRDPNDNAENHCEHEAPTKRRKVDESPQVSESPKKKKETFSKQNKPESLRSTRTSPRKAFATEDKLATQVKIKEELTSAPKPPKVPKLEVHNLPVEVTVKQEVKPLYPISEECKSWTDKYKPSNLKEIIGQQESNSNMKKLLTWLQNWTKYHASGSKLKVQRPSPWAKNDDGAFFKAVLLSGAPGVGKTTTATLVAKELGYDIVEFNASDTRSKKLLHEEVATLLSSKSLTTFFKDGSAPTNKHVLLMDEVDGMSGNQDRGGIQELIALIKNASVPIMCICNDRQHPKIRSLVNHCFDLRFNKIKPETIRGAMMSVCFKEGIKIKPDALMHMILATGNDIRQTLNHLAMWSASGKDMSSELIRKESDSAKKDTILGPWEVVTKVFSAEQHKTMRLDEKAKLFYFDYNISPLFVQENYLQVEPNSKNPLKAVARAADAISRGDVIEAKIRSGNNWSLMDSQAFHASVLPGHYMSGRFKGQINFPGWLGKNSKHGKFQRFAAELQSHMRLSASTTKEAVNLDYIYALRDNIINPLIKNGTSGVGDSVQVMKNYNLLRDDLDSILELAQWSNQKDPMARVESKVKAAFTRAYNKDSPLLPYSIDTVAKKRTTAKEDVYGGEEDDNLSDEDNKDDIGNDAMIKAKKTAAKPKKEEAFAGKKPAAKAKPKKAK